MLVRKGRLVMDVSLKRLLECIERDDLILPLGPPEVTLAVDLNLEQADPFDREIVATACCQNVPLITKDRQITQSRSVPVIW